MSLLPNPKCISLITNTYVIIKYIRDDTEQMNDPDIYCSATNFVATALVVIRVTSRALSRFKSNPLQSRDVTLETTQYKVGRLSACHCVGSKAKP